MEENPVRRRGGVDRNIHERPCEPLNKPSIVYCIRGPVSRARQAYSFKSLTPAELTHGNRERAKAVDSESIITASARAISFRGCLEGLLDHHDCGLSTYYLGRYVQSCWFRSLKRI